MTPILNSTDEVLGILGGLGPLASAEFLKTIYENCQREREQDTPKVIVYSDPTFPDRTEAIISGQYGALLDRLVSSLRALTYLGATQTVVCCVTLHALFDRLPGDLRAQLISIVDVIFEEITRVPEKRLLICSTGAREIGLFESHEQWPVMREYIVLPDDQDQALVHRSIYQIKQLRSLDELASIFTGLLPKYGVNSFISGCTEMHIIAKRLASATNIDPLSVIAKKFPAKAQSRKTVETVSANSLR